MVVEQISLKSARMNVGLSIEQVSERTGIPQKELGEWEEDSGKVPARIASELLSLYRISSDHVYFGKKQNLQLRVS